MRWYIVSLGSKTVSLREKTDNHARKRFHKIVERAVAAAIESGAAARAEDARLFRAKGERPTKVMEGYGEVGTAADI